MPFQLKAAKRHSLHSHIRVAKSRVNPSVNGPLARITLAGRLVNLCNLSALSGRASSAISSLPPWTALRLYTTTARSHGLAPQTSSPRSRSTSHGPCSLPHHQCLSCPSLALICISTSLALPAPPCPMHLNRGATNCPSRSP